MPETSTLLKSIVPDIRVVLWGPLCYSLKRSFILFSYFSLQGSILTFLQCSVIFIFDWYHSWLLSDKTHEITSKPFRYKWLNLWLAFVAHGRCYRAVQWNLSTQHSTALSVSLRIVRFYFPPVTDPLCTWKLIQRLSFISRLSSFHCDNLSPSSLTEIPLVDRMSERVSCDLAFKYVSFSAFCATDEPHSCLA